jgi:hypothetical protein
MLSADAGQKSPMLYRVRLAIARKLAAVRLHQVEIRSDPSGLWLIKRRRMFSEVFILLGNLYLRVQGAPAEALSCRRWIALELQLAGLLGRTLHETSDSVGIEQPLIPGTDLEQLLKSSRPLTEKLRGIYLASVALHQLHELVIPGSDANSSLVSHGDATCRNVIVDLDVQTANWIDFDLQHRPHLPIPNRHADDVRALLCSSAACLEPTCYEQCLAAIRDGYGHRQVFDVLSSYWKTLAKPSVFILAQAPLRYGEVLYLQRLVILKCQADNTTFRPSVFR